MKKIIGYIPTIEGKPARWSDGQLCFCTLDNWEDEPFNPCIYKSKKSVANLIKKSISYRQKLGFECFPSDYGYITVERN